MQPIVHVNPGKAIKHMKCHSLLSFVHCRLTWHNIFASDGKVLKGFIKVRKPITYSIWKK